MKRYSLCFSMIICSLFILSFNCKKAAGCANLKNGQFYYYSKISRHKIDIERFDSLQLETDTENKLVLKNKIVWKSECIFNMYINAFGAYQHDKIDSLIAVTPVAVEITSVEAAYYICQARMKISNREIAVTDTIYLKKLLD